MERRALKFRVPLSQRCPDQAGYARDGEPCCHAQHSDAFPAPPHAAKLTEAWSGVAYFHRRPLDTECGIACGCVPSYPAAIPAATRDLDQCGSERCHLHWHLHTVHKGDAYTQK